MKPIRQEFFPTLKQARVRCAELEATPGISMSFYKAHRGYTVEVWDKIKDLEEELEETLQSSQTQN